MSSGGRDGVRVLFGGTLVVPDFDCFKGAEVGRRDVYRGEAVIEEGGQEQELGGAHADITGDERAAAYAVDAVAQEQLAAFAGDEIHRVSFEARGGDEVGGGGGAG